MSSNDRLMPEELKHVLARTSVIQDACAFDLLVFFYRHPLAILTSEQLSVFIGHDLKKIGTSLEALINAGFLIRAKHPTHAARMYCLMLNGPLEQGLTALLEFASTLRGRRSVLQNLKAGRSQVEPGALPGTATDARKLDNA